MSFFTYSYTKEVNIFRLSDEIRSNQSITVALEIVEFTPPYACRVIMRDALSESQKLILDSIVGSHLPTPLDDTSDLLLKAPDNRQIVKASIRPLNTNGYFTNCGDDLSVWNNIGGGSQFIVCDHKIGDPATISIDVGFNVEGNRTFGWNGYVKYENAKSDLITMTFKARATSYTTASGTNYKKSSSGLIMPAVGTGTIDITGSTLYPVSTVPKTDTGLCPAAYWDLDFSNGVYSNLRPAATPNSSGLPGNGKYNLFWSEVTFKKYINKFPMLGSGEFEFLATDPSELGTNVRVITEFVTMGADHEWSAIFNMSMFREKIV